MANELEVRIKALAEAIAADIKISKNQDGDLTSLTTLNKTNLVDAINEVLQIAQGASESTNLSVGLNGTTSLEVESSTGDNVTLLAATSLLAGLMSSIDKAKLEGIESQATANNSDAFLLERSNHTGTQPTSTISDFTAEVNNIVNTVIDGAPGSLDTLNELAAALGDDPNFATTIATGLSERVRFDAPQTKTLVERTQACENIGVGNPDRDFVLDYIVARDS